MTLNGPQGAWLQRCRLTLQAAKQPRSGFDRQFDIHRTLFLAKSAAKFREGDILQLPNPFPCNAEFLADFLERLGLATVQTETLENDFFFTIIQHIEQTAHFVA